MKLLLTSNGLTNPVISKTLFDLVGKSPVQTKMVFVPTAANAEEGDKAWLEENLANMQKQNFQSLEIVDISEGRLEDWLPKFEQADGLFFNGGNTYHLMHWLNKSGLGARLPELLKDKVYAGSSAGSMVACPTLSLSTSKIIYSETFGHTTDIRGLGLVDFYFLPHYNSAEFSKEKLSGLTKKTYALDDNTALKVVDNNVEIISEGEYLLINA